MTPSRISGAALIAAERERQITEEGWTSEHDDQHIGGELRQAAACYALGYRRPGIWPWAVRWWKPRDRVRDLVRAGALIAAEIDRIQRASANSSLPKGRPR